MILCFKFVFIVFNYISVRFFGSRSTKSIWSESTVRLGSVILVFSLVRITKLETGLYPIWIPFDSRSVLVFRLIWVKRKKKKKKKIFSD